jgi:hypothetical protein
MTSTAQFAADDGVVVVSEDDQYRQPPADAYPPDRQVLVSEPLLRSTIDSLERIDEFFRRYASPSIREDLHAYALAQGWHPTTGPGAFLDAIAFGVRSLTLAITDREETGTSMT